MLPCVECFPDSITTFLSQFCGQSPTASFDLMQNSNLCINSGRALLTTFDTTPNQIFPSPTSSVISCTLVLSAAGNAVLTIDGVAPSEECVMPSIYPVTIPVVFVSPSPRPPGTRRPPITAPAPSRRLPLPAAGSGRLRRRRDPGGR
jgi:hypothetical protein